MNKYFFILLLLFTTIIPNKWALSAQAMAQLGFLPQTNGFKTNNNMIRYSLSLVYKK